MTATITRSPLELIKVGKEGEARDILTDRSIRPGNVSALEQPCIAVTRGGEVVFVKGRKYTRSGSGKSPTVTVVTRNGAEYAVRTGAGGGTAMMRDAWQADLFHIFPYVCYPHVYTALTADVGMSPEKDYTHGKKLPVHYKWLPKLESMLDTARDVVDGTVTPGGLSQVGEEFERKSIARMVEHFEAMAALKMITPVFDYDPAQGRVKEAVREVQKEQGLVEQARKAREERRSTMEDRISSAGPASFITTAIASVRNGRIGENVVSIEPTKDRDAVRLVVGAYYSAMQMNMNKWGADDIDILIEQLQQVQQILRS